MAIPGPANVDNRVSWDVGMYLSRAPVPAPHRDRMDATRTRLPALVDDRGAQTVLTGPDVLDCRREDITNLRPGLIPLCITHDVPWTDADGVCQHARAVLTALGPAMDRLSQVRAAREVVDALREAADEISSMSDIRGEWDAPVMVAAWLNGDADAREDNIDLEL